MGKAGWSNGTAAEQQGPPATSSQQCPARHKPKRQGPTTSYRNRSDSTRNRPRRGGWSLPLCPGGTIFRCGLASRTSAEISLENLTQVGGSWLELEVQNLPATAWYGFRRCNGRAGGTLERVWHRQGFPRASAQQSNGGILGALLAARTGDDGPSTRGFRSSAQARRKAQFILPSNGRRAEYSARSPE
jgi:hypothetical protein